MKKISILTSCANLKQITDGEIGIYWDCPPDSDLYKRYSSAIQFNELLRNTEKTRKFAANLANKMVYNEPLTRSIPQLSIFQEVIATELNKALLIVNLHDILLQKGFKVCNFYSSNWVGDGLAKLCKLIESPLQVNIPYALKSNKLMKLCNRVLENKLSFSTIREEFLNLVKKVDKFNHRNLFVKWCKNKNFNRNKIWFYTTSFNYTNIGLLYEKYFPENFNFLIENSQTGGKPLRDLNRPFNLIYEFSQLRFIPQRAEIQSAINTLYSHICNCSVNKEEELAKQFFLNCSWLVKFFTQLLPRGLLLSSISDNWLNIAEPSMLVVGNPVFEGYALYQAKKKNIPTLLLQHGLLGSYYPYSDHPIDHYFVRGKFWYDFLSQVSRKRAHIVNLIPSNKKSTLVNEKNSYIIFATTPARNTGDMFIDTDMELILLKTIQTLAKTSVKLIIRVHPLEKINDYIHIVNKLLKGKNDDIRLEYSQGGDIDSLVSGALAVVMYCSTMFLDCIKYDIPIISFNWIDFGFMEKIKSYHFFYLANSLSEFGQLLTRAVHGDLPPNTSNSNLFLEKQSFDEITTKIKNLTGFL